LKFFNNLYNIEGSLTDFHPLTNVLSVLDTRDITRRFDLVNKNSVVSKLLTLRT